jgi:predicted esterase
VERDRPRVIAINLARKLNHPIITIHGDHDDVVSYGHAVRLPEALDKARVINELYRKSEAWSDHTAAKEIYLVAAARTTSWLAPERARSKAAR